MDRGGVIDFRGEVSLIEGWGGVLWALRRVEVLDAGLRHD